MKMFLAVIIIILNLNNAFAENIIEVSSLSDDACLYYESNNGQRAAKVASFNQSLAWSIDEEMIKGIGDQLNEYLKKFNFQFKSNDYEMYLHCGAYGTSLVMNIDMEGFHLCPWFQLDELGAHIRNIGVTDQFGSCDGYIPGRMVIYTTGDEGTYMVEKELSDPRWRVMISDIASGGYNKITIFLTGKYVFSEMKVRDSLLESIDKVYIKYIETESLYYPIGEFKRMEMFGN